MKIEYHAPEGATSITVGGESFDVKDGILAVPEGVSHADLLSHGYRLLGDAVVVTAREPSKDEVIAAARQLQDRADALFEREQSINSRAAELETTATALIARSAELDAREAALTAPPPPPPPVPSAADAAALAAAQALDKSTKRGK